ncbi:MAG: MBL fold metallo-hydrolase, partial [Muribaculaceae bacterium]|nr:MBL fold metallo-hydrolase [Muribaculaceae bacterium]
MFRRIAFSLVALACLSVSAKKDLTYFWQDKDGIINAQTELTFELVNEIINADKPSTEAPSQARKAALYLLDQMFHDTRLDNSPMVSQFLDGRMEIVLADLKTPLKKGMKVYKLYNDGWIIRTPKVTIGWDIYRGRKVKDSERRLMSDSIASALADACDIMFLTHNHPDHVDPFVVECMTSKGKPVVAPDEILADNKAVTHTRKEEIWKETFKAANGAKLKATIIPGHQDHLQNNIYVVTTPDGYTVSSTGDQWLKSDLDMVLNLQGKITPVDVFMPICWAAKLPEMCQSFGSKVVLTGHENELGDHTIDHREAYWLSYNKLEDFP